MEWVSSERRRGRMLTLWSLRRRHRVHMRVLHRSVLLALCLRLPQLLLLPLLPWRPSPNVSAVHATVGIEVCPKVCLKEAFVIQVHGTAPLPSRRYRRLFVFEWVVIQIYGTGSPPTWTCSRLGGVAPVRLPGCRRLPEGRPSGPRVRCRRPSRRGREARVR